MKPKYFTREEIPQRVLDRFWSTVDIRGPEDCWPWGGGYRGDYGRVCARIDGRLIAFSAHRVAYITKHGAIEPDALACHSCDNPACCNPNHIFPGTSADNSKDMKNKGRSRSGGRHPRSVLTDFDVSEIRRIGRSNPSRVLAKEFGVDASTIRSVIRGDTWK